MDAQAAAVAVDADSRRGRFGWVEVNQLFVPFVFRGEERTKWCGVRVAERLVLGALLGVPRAALECAAVDAVTMTKAEAELHNEINTKHLNSKMGKEMFTMTDAMVRLCDLQQLVIFLKFCQRRLAGQEVVAAGRCGFKRIQAEEEASDVPYVVVGGEPSLPVFYFEGDTEALAGAARVVGGWDLAYLRLLCAVQGVRLPLVRGPTPARVTSLATVLGCFPESAAVEEFWPATDFLPRAGSASAGCWAMVAASLPPWLAPPLTTIKDWPITSATDYTLRRAKVGAMAEVDVLNVRPGEHADLLVTLADLAACLRPDLGLEGTHTLLRELGVVIYGPNTRQTELLARRGKAAGLRPVPLVLVADVLKHMGELEEKGGMKRRVGV